MKPAVRNDVMPEEQARVTIEGKVIGESPMANHLRERLLKDRRIDRYTDGRDLLHYISASYSTGYRMVGFANEESQQILNEMSDREYARWRNTTDLDMMV